MQIIKDAISGLEELPRHRFVLWSSLTHSIPHQSFKEIRCYYCACI